MKLQTSMNDQKEHKTAIRIKRYFPFKPPRYYCSVCKSSFLRETYICPRCKAYFRRIISVPMTVTEDEIFRCYCGENSHE